MSYHTTCSLLNVTRLKALPGSPGVLFLELNLTGEGRSCWLPSKIISPEALVDRFGAVQQCPRLSALPAAPVLSSTWLRCWASHHDSLSLMWGQGSPRAQGARFCWEAASWSAAPLRSLPFEPAALAASGTASNLTGLKQSRGGFKPISSSRVCLLISAHASAS